MHSVANSHGMVQIHQSFSYEGAKSEHPPQGKSPVDRQPRNTFDGPGIYPEFDLQLSKTTSSFRRVKTVGTGFVQRAVGFGSLMWLLMLLASIVISAFFPMNLANCVALTAAITLTVPAGDTFPWLRYVSFTQVHW